MKWYNYLSLKKCKLVTNARRHVAFQNLLLESTFESLLISKLIDTVLQQRLTKSESGLILVEGFKEALEPLIIRIYNTDSQHV